MKVLMTLIVPGEEYSTSQISQQCLGHISMESQVHVVLIRGTRSGLTLFGFACVFAHFSPYALQVQRMRGHEDIHVEWLLQSLEGDEDYSCIRALQVLSDIVK